MNTKSSSFWRKSLTCGVAATLSVAAVRAEYPWFNGFINVTNSYRIFAHSDWDTSLFGGGALPDSDCLGVSSPSWRVDGHVVLEADGKGNFVVVESTGSFASSDLSLGSVHPIAARNGDPYFFPPNTPASDTRNDYNSNFVNIMADPVNQSLTNAPELRASIVAGAAVPTVNLSWASDTNHIYQIEWASKIDGTSVWNFWGGRVVGNGTTNIVGDAISTNSARFYRIITVQ